MMSDEPIRLAAFEKLRRLQQSYGKALPWEVIKKGFDYNGEKFLFASQAEGIFKPRQMDQIISIKTVVPREGRKIWYLDQNTNDKSTNYQENGFTYSFKGINPNNKQNQLLFTAMLEKTPIIYFIGISPAHYEPIYPSYINNWNANGLTCQVITSSIINDISITDAKEIIMNDNFGWRNVRCRLFQTKFRERVIDAYGRRCAMTNLPELQLVDAAHIVAVRDDEKSMYSISNGICMSKIHHAAFDSLLIGIDPDYQIHVADAILDMSDGPMLEHGIKALHGKKIRLPIRQECWPDRDKLAVKFDEFLKGL